MKIHGILSLIYGVYIIACGLYRFSVAGSKNALWFGVVMGVFALVAGLIGLLHKSRASFFIQAITIIFVGGFFINKALGGFEDDSAFRVISLIVFSLIMAGFTFKGIFSKPELKKE